MGAGVPHSPCRIGDRGSKSSLTPDSVAVHSAFAAAISPSVHGLVWISLGCRGFGVKAEVVRLVFRSGRGGALLLASARTGNQRLHRRRATVSERSISDVLHRLGEGLKSRREDAVHSGVS